MSRDSNDRDRSENDLDPARIMRGFPPPPEQRVDRSRLLRPPYNRWAFKNMRRLLPTAPIVGGNRAISEFVRRDAGLGALLINGSDSEATRLPDFLAARYCDGFLVLHQGQIIGEYYFDGMREETPHLLMSMSKSLVGNLVGIFVENGMLSLADRIGTLIPALAASGLADATLLDVLNMRSGIDFVEDYANPPEVFQIYDLAAGFAPRRSADDPKSVYDVIVGLKTIREHGGYFRYQSPMTEVLAWAMEEASGKPLNELLSRHIWSHLGVEHETYITLDDGGMGLADGGICASLRDWGRFARLQLTMGKANGRQIVPADWIAASRRGDCDAFEPKEIYGGADADVFEEFPHGTYSNQWWVLDNRIGRYAAFGIHGQMTIIDPQSDLAIVSMASWPHEIEHDLAHDMFVAFDSILAALAN